MKQREREQYEAEIVKSDAENARLEYILRTVYDMVTDRANAPPNWVGDEIKELLDLEGYGPEGLR